MPNIEKQRLRKELRALRNQLSAADQDSAAESLCQVLANVTEFQTATTIAFYYPSDGEISPLPLLKTAWALNKSCFLPVLPTPNRHELIFASYQEHQPLVSNQFGILEPDLSTASTLPCLALSMILVPLVGFDRQGGRLGMGGGFYDATFNELKEMGKAVERPRLIGLGHGFQELQTIPLEPWDWPLDAVATEKRYIKFN